MTPDPSMRRSCKPCSGRGFVGTLECVECHGHAIAEIKCAQCWAWKNWRKFIGKEGKLIRRCTDCVIKYRRWQKLSPEERMALTEPRRRIKESGPLRVKFNLQSGNRKTGPIPVSMTSAETCPKSCAFYNAGCYAEQHLLAVHWARVSSGIGIMWQEFCQLVAALPEGQLWRHNEAGDLPGVGEQIENYSLSMLVRANRGRRGFTYTHKPMTVLNARWVAKANDAGFTINLSANGVAHADELAELGIAPVVCLLPWDAHKKGNKTPKGRPIVVCPAEYSEKVSCATCALCQKRDRKTIVGFRAHGDRKKLLTTRLRQLPLFDG